MKAPGLLLLLFLGLLAIWAELPPASGQTEICRLPKEVGPCLAAFSRWFYNGQTQKCEAFTYGGCQGNANNFKTLEECQKKCERLITNWLSRTRPGRARCSSRASELFGFPPDPTWPSPRGRRDREGEGKGSPPTPLSLSLSLGPGDAALPPDRSAMRSDDFARSGFLLLLFFFFLGGPSPFWTDGPSASSQFVDMCSTFPAESESCGEPKRRFFYNTTSQRCEPFLHRGCTWNLNQFYTIEECQRHCGKIEKPGSCPPSPTVITTECLTGCMHDGSCPNDQKCCSFGCALRCSDPLKDLCRMPPEKGPCHANIQNWYYDWQTRRCKRFTFGGCLGNKNNFKKRKECQLRCARRSK
uniref:Actinia tenebrosa protease inhibitors-like n=1 Tax=Pogona vitticeps TaxID=103695 RepID=A0ABM5G4J8_9SAUR